MEYMEGTSFPLSDGSWLKVDVTLTDDDLVKVVREWFSDRAVDARALSTIVRYEVLALVASDILLRREIVEFTSRAVQDAARKTELKVRMERLVTRRQTLHDKLLAVPGFAK